jgi:hypothetical protein
VVPHERREAGHVLVTDVEAVRPQLVHRGVHVPRVEQHEGVEDQAQGADLVLSELPRGTLNDVGEAEPCAEGNGKNLA